jgi:hypothetical protein
LVWQNTGRLRTYERSRHLRVVRDGRVVARAAAQASVMKLLLRRRERRDWEKWWELEVKMLVSHL